MHQSLVAAAAIALVGCSTLTPERARVMAQATPDWELCYVMLSSKFPRVAREAVTDEATRRRVDCNQHLQMVMLKMQDDQARSAQSPADIANGLRLIEASRAKPAPMPAPAWQQTKCRSVWVGNVLQTVCDTN